MTEKLVLDAQIRTDFGKGAARRARRDGQVPAVVYGKGGDTQHITVPGHDLFLIARDYKRANVELRIDGKPVQVVVQDVQVHPVTRNLLHADFLIESK